MLLPCSATVEPRDSCNHGTLLAGDSSPADRYLPRLLSEHIVECLGPQNISQVRILRALGLDVDVLPQPRRRDIGCNIDEPSRRLAPGLSARRSVDT